MDNEQNKQFTPAADPAPVDDKRRELADKAWDFLNWKHGPPKNQIQIVAQDSICGDMADFAASVTADKDKQIAELEARDAELRNIEFILSRRTALDGCKTTADKIYLMLKLCAELDPNAMQAFAALEDNSKIDAVLMEETK